MTFFLSIFLLFRNIRIERMWFNRFKWKCLVFVVDATQLYARSCFTTTRKRWILFIYFLSLQLIVIHLLVRIITSTAITVNDAVNCANYHNNRSLILCLFFSTFSGTIRNSSRNPTRTLNKDTTMKSCVPSSWARDAFAHQSRAVKDETKRYSELGHRYAYTGHKNRQDDNWTFIWLLWSFIWAERSEYFLSTANQMKNSYLYFCVCIRYL